MIKLGPTFSDSLSKGNMRSKSSLLGEKQPISRRILPILILAIGFSLLVFQLAKLQLFQGKSYRALADNNRMRVQTLYAPRGILYDRNGLPLVLNIPGFRQILKDCNGKDCTKVLTRDEVIKQEANGKKIPNLSIDSLRSYIHPEAFAHVLGYISEITEDELKQDQYLGNYAVGDRIGREGIEQTYEDQLKGVKGKEFIETDAMGEPVRTLGKVDPIPGQDLTLTLDEKLQLTAYEAIKDKVGAVIVSNPKTGEILALVSSPSFDSNLFTLGEDYQKQKEASTSGYTSLEKIITDSQYMPLFNRAVAGAYPPGSTFKIVTSAAGLESKSISKDTRIEDTGVIEVGGSSFANWFYTEYGRKESDPLDVVTALKRSNDIFFYKAAEMTGLSNMQKMASKFFLSRTLGIDIPNEVGGLFPSEKWKEDNYGDQWYLGDTYHLGIGQGFLLTTPLQVNSWTNVIANGGTLYQPYLLKDKKPITLSSNFLSTETIGLIRQGMQEACEPGGTGYPLFNFKVKNDRYKIDDRNFFAPPDATVSGQTNGYVHIPVVCKTGTAEVGSTNDTHAWFTAYAPAADPQISITVLVEKGGQGSDVAAPIAKKIFEDWFSR